MFLKNTCVVHRFNDEQIPAGCPVIENAKVLDSWRYAYNRTMCNSNVQCFTNLYKLESLNQAGKITHPIYGDIAYFFEEMSQPITDSESSASAPCVHDMNGVVADRPDDLNPNAVYVNTCMTLLEWLVADPKISKLIRFKAALYQHIISTSPSFCNNIPILYEHDYGQISKLLLLSIKEYCNDKDSVYTTIKYDLDRMGIVY